MEYLESLPLDSIHKFVCDVSVNALELTEQVVGLNVGSWPKPQFLEEFKNSVDHVDKGDYPDPGQRSDFHVEFFDFDFVYPLGPFYLEMDFYAGGVLGLKFDVQVKSVDSLMQTKITPFVACEIKASVTLSAVIITGGIELNGMIMKISFPLSLTTNFSKQPVVSTKKLDAELIPLELRLSGWIRVNLLLWKHTWRKTYWHWKADAIRGNVWTKEHRKNDLGPPKFPYCDRVHDQCFTALRDNFVLPLTFGNSLLGRHHLDCAFKLEFHAEDDDSDLSVSYAIGDYPGGTNVQGWTDMRGGSLVVPAMDLPQGKPLYFLVKAVNSQKLSTTAQCTLATLDCTLPEGRVDAAYRCTSHPSKLATGPPSSTTPAFRYVTVSDSY
nr:hypothetical protein BaRGS_029597 [Batillaria attramentaria]